MRILVVTQYFWPENFKINDLVSGLLDRGHHVEILTGSPNYPEGKVFPQFRNNAKKFESYKGAKIHRVPIVTRGQTKFSLLLNYLSFIFSASFIGRLKVKASNFEIILVFEPSPITVCLPAIWLARSKKVPIFLWVLDLWPDTLKAVGVISSPRLLKRISLLVQFIYSRCAVLLLSSKMFFPRVLSLTGDDKKLHYFPNWAEEIFLNCAPKQNKRKNNEFRILFAGNVGEAQDFPTILKAFSTFLANEKIYLDVAGEGRMHYWLSNEIVQAGLQERVKLLGKLDLSEMPKLYAEADALLLALKDEEVFKLTIPAKLQTYMASGKPVICATGGESERVVYEANAGVVCKPGSAMSIVAGIRELKELSLKSRKKLGDNGKQFADQMFNRSQLIDSFVALAAHQIKQNSKKIN